MFLTQLFLIQLCLTKILSFEKRFFHLFNLSSFFPFSFCKHVLQLKGLVTSSRHFCFPKFSPWKATGCKEKIKLPFSWSLLKLTYFQKSHTRIGCFGRFTKLKRRMELVFTAGFPHTFSIKMFLIKCPISLNIWGSGLAG